MKITRALIVDDNPMNLYLLRSVLTGQGCEVDEACHGAEALVRARQNPPDLVISDLLMPVMDGYALLRRWKADEQLKKIPFVVYTATYTGDSDRQLALDLGADAFLIKPLEPDAFVACIREVLAKETTRDTLPSLFGTGDEALMLERLNEVLVCKLESKIQQLEDTNRVLAEQLDELRRWHAVMIRREDRIQELKHEVNELCRWQGAAIRYESQSQDAPATAETGGRATGAHDER